MPPLKFQLFRHFAQNWNYVKMDLEFDSDFPDEFADAVLCPLCLTIHNKLSLELTNHPDELTVEHVPPESLGGKGAVLTCRKCNSTTGSMLESKLREFLLIKPFRDSNDASVVKLPKVMINNVTSSGQLTYYKDRKFHFKLNLKEGRDDYRLKMLRQLEGQTDFQIQFKWHEPAKKFVHLAMLKIAYLMVFQKFGHGYIMNSNLNSIREQILKPNEDILKGICVSFSGENGFPQGIYFLNKPDVITGLFVVFNLLIDGKVTKCSLILPSPLVDSKEFFDTYSGMTTLHIATDDIEVFKEIDFLHDENFVYGVSQPFMKYKK